MTQQLTLPSINVANNNNADKALKSAANSKDSEAFASELDRRVNDSKQPEKDKITKADSKTDSQQAEKNTKAEKTESKDGKKLPSDTTDKDSEKTDVEVKESDVEQASKVTDDANQMAIISVTPLTEATTAKKAPELGAVENKPIPQPIVMDVSNPKNINAESSTNSIRADILQAIQKQSGEGGEAVATEKFKSMMQAAAQTPQQATAVSAEVIASMRQLEPQTERSSATKLSSPLVFSTTVGAATPVIGATSVASPTLSLDIQPQLNNAAWGRVMSSRVVWMAREGVQQAELRLNPAHLGPVEVRLSMQNEQTSVTFIASNAAARDALEQALPRLRESFAENGLALNHAEVSHQQQSSQGSEQDEQLQDGKNMAQVIVEMDDIEDETALQSDLSADNSVGVSVFA